MPVTIAASTPYTPGAAGVMAGWIEPGCFQYDPRHGHELVIRSTRIDDVILAVFEDHRPLELAWDAMSPMVLGIAWRFTAIEPKTWQGTTFSWWRSRQCPVLENVRDAGAMPDAAKLLRVYLKDLQGEVRAARLLRLEREFAWRFNFQVVDQYYCFNRDDRVEDTTRQLLRRYRDPSDIAAAVTREAAFPLMRANPKRYQHCLAVNV